MNRSLFYLSHDPVNEHYVRNWVEERGGTFSPLSLLDPLPNGDCQLLLIDWDSLDSDSREEYLAGLLAQPGGRRIGLHSYHLADAETVGRKGVAVFARLEPKATPGWRITPSDTSGARPVLSGRAFPGHTTLRPFTVAREIKRDLRQGDDQEVSIMTNLIRSYPDILTLLAHPHPI
jgi:hypothetical protein